MLPNHRRREHGDGGRVDARGQDGRIYAPVGFAWVAWAVLVVLAILLVVACDLAQAQEQERQERAEQTSGPAFIAHLEGTTIVLYADSCAFREVVQNLYMRATWTDEGDVPLEGCWSVLKMGVVIFYFADRTVAAVPSPLFKRLGRT